LEEGEEGGEEDGERFIFPFGLCPPPPPTSPRDPWKEAIGCRSGGSNKEGGRRSDHAAESRKSRNKKIKRAQAGW